jgi:hypothetical protein
VDQAHRPAPGDPQPGRSAEAVQRIDSVQQQRRLSPASFSFLQFEFPGVIGPPDGRYVMRSELRDAADAVLVVQTLGAPARSRLRGRRPRSAPPEPPPSPVTITRATIIAAQPFEGPEQAGAWLARGEFEPQIHSGLAALNRAIAAHRAAAQDPSARDLSAEQALVIRAGYGAGEEVAYGRWTQALEVNPATGRRPRREAALRSQERLAALLGGRDRVLACEEPALASRAALDGGRQRVAALLLEVALRAALAELPASGAVAGLPERVSELAQRRPAVSAAAEAALRGPLAEDQEAGVRQTLERLEAALRARAAAGPWR